MFIISMDVLLCKSLSSTLWIQYAEDFNKNRGCNKCVYVGYLIRDKAEIKVPLSVIEGVQ